MMSNIKYEETPEFKKDLKRLLKKFPSLLEDLELAKKASIEFFHINKINNLSVFPIPDFCSNLVQVCKIKKFACHALKGRGAKSGIRVIYAYYPAQFKVVFLEIYFKTNQENENRERIKNFLKGT